MPKRIKSQAASEPQKSPLALLTPDAFARAISFNPESVRRIVREGRIKAVKLGRSWRIPSSELDRVAAHGL